MTDYIYDAPGNAVGFWYGRYIYSLKGKPIGQMSSHSG